MHRTSSNMKIIRKINAKEIVFINITRYVSIFKRIYPKYTEYIHNFMGLCGKYLKFNLKILKALCC